MLRGESGEGWQYAIKKDKLCPGRQALILALRLLRMATATTGARGCSTFVSGFIARYCGANERETTRELQKAIVNDGALTLVNTRIYRHVDAMPANEMPPTNGRFVARHLTGKERGQCYERWRAPNTKGAELGTAAARALIETVAYARTSDGYYVLVFLHGQGPDVDVRDRSNYRLVPLQWLSVLYRIHKTASPPWKPDPATYGHAEHASMWPVRVGDCKVVVPGDGAGDYAPPSAQLSYPTDIRYIVSLLAPDVYKAALSPGVLHVVSGAGPSSESAKPAARRVRKKNANASKAPKRPMVPRPVDAPLLPDSDVVPWRAWGALPRSARILNALQVIKNLSVCAYDMAQTGNSSIFLLSGIRWSVPTVCSGALVLGRHVNTASVDARGVCSVMGDAVVAAGGTGTAFPVLVLHTVIQLRERKMLGLTTRVISESDLPKLYDMRTPPMPVVSRPEAVSSLPAPIPAPAPTPARNASPLRADPVLIPKPKTPSKKRKVAQMEEVVPPVPVPDAVPIPTTAAVPSPEPALAPIVVTQLLAKKRRLMPLKLLPEKALLPVPENAGWWAHEWPLPLQLKKISARREGLKRAARPGSQVVIGLTPGFSAALRVALQFFTIGQLAFHAKRAPSIGPGMADPGLWLKLRALGSQIDAGVDFSDVTALLGQRGLFVYAACTSFFGFFMRCIPLVAGPEAVVAGADKEPHLADAFYARDIAARIGGGLGAFGRPVVPPDAPVPSLADGRAREEASVSLLTHSRAIGEDDDEEEEEAAAEAAGTKFGGIPLPVARTLLPWPPECPLSLDVYNRLAGDSVIDDGGMAERFRKKHAFLLYSRHANVTPSEMVRVMESFFCDFRESRAKMRGANGGGDILSVHPIWFWVMCAHFAAACLLPLDKRPWPGPPDSVSLTDFEIF